MSKIKLTGSNSGYVEISSAADAGNLTLALPTSGTALLSNAGNVFSGITTFTGLNITDDVTFNGGSYDVLWDASDNQLEFGDNAKLSFGASSDLQIWHDGSHTRMHHQGTGQLIIYGNDNDQVKLMKGSSEEGIILNNNGNVELYFNNNKKIETTNTGAVVSGICTATSFSGDGSGLSNTSHRRLNYNGAMMVNQRGNLTGVTLGGYRSVDRYYTQMENSNAGTWSIGQSTDVPDGYGFKYSLEYGCTATSSNANRYLMTLYRLEGFDSQVFNYGTANAKTVTLSFWIKCSKAGNFQVNFENEDNPDAGYQTQQTINSAGQWEKKVVTIPGDTNKAFAWTSAKAMCFDIVYSAFGNYASQTPTAAWSTLANEQRGGHCNMDLFDSTSNYVKITGVQLEIGSTATEFEHIPYADELIRCKRYFQSSFPSGVAPQNGYYATNTGASAGYAGATCFSANNARSPQIYYGTEMRAQPGITLYSSSNNDTAGKWGIYSSGSGWTTPSTNTVDYFSNRGFGVRYSSASFGTVGESYLYRGMWAADAEI